MGRIGRGKSCPQSWSRLWYTRIFARASGNVSSHLAAMYGFQTPLGHPYRTTPTQPPALQGPLGNSRCVVPAAMQISPGEKSFSRAKLGIRPRTLDRRPTATHARRFTRGWKRSMRGLCFSGYQRYGRVTAALVSAVCRRLIPRRIGAVVNASPIGTSRSKIVWRSTREQMCFHRPLIFPILSKRRTCWRICTSSETRRQLFIIYKEMTTGWRRSGHIFVSGRENSSIWYWVRRTHRYQEHWPVYGLLVIVAPGPITPER